MNSINKERLTLAVGVSEEEKNMDAKMELLTNAILLNCFIIIIMQIINKFTKKQFS